MINQSRIDELNKEKLFLLDKWSKEAFLFESEVREFAFTNAYIDILGYQSKQFTLRHYIALDFNANMFVKGAGDIDPTNHIIDFLWTVSPAFTYDKDKFIQFDKQVRQSINEKGAEVFIVEINDYMNKALMDIPIDGEIDDKAPTISYIALIIDSLVTEYHWTDEYILDLPYARILQYMRAIEQRKAKERGETVHNLNNRYTTPIEKRIHEIETEIENILQQEENAKS